MRQQYEFLNRPTEFLHQMMGGRHWNPLLDQNLIKWPFGFKVLRRLIPKKMQEMIWEKIAVKKQKTIQKMRSEGKA